MIEIDDGLRALVRQTVREAVAELRPAAKGDGPGPVVTPLPAPGAQHLTSREPRRRTETVRIASDGDLDSFVRHVLALADNPRTREELRNGWLRFRLAGSSGTMPAPGVAPTSGALRVERGVVTERTVAEAASQGRPIVAAKAAVITPLARDKARSLGVHIEKER